MMETLVRCRLLGTDSSGGEDFGLPYRSAKFCVRIRKILCEDHRVIQLFYQSSLNFKNLDVEPKFRLSDLGKTAPSSALARGAFALSESFARLHWWRTYTGRLYKGAVCRCRYRTIRLRSVQPRSVGARFALRRVTTVDGETRLSRRP